MANNRSASDPLVSVVMAVFNQERTVRRAMASILGQTFTDFEIIVIDDASTDGTHDELTRMGRSDSRLKIFRNKANIGLAGSLNLAWRASRGQLIARMDGDDVSNRNRFEMQVAFLKDHPEIGVLGTAAELFDPAGEPIGVAVRPADHDTLVSLMHREIPFIHPSVMMRRSVLELTNGYNERLRRAQDADLWFRAEQHFRFHNLSTPLLSYTVSERQSFLAITMGARVFIESGIRRGHPLIGIWSGARCLAAGLLTRAGLTNVRLR